MPKHPEDVRRAIAREVMHERGPAPQKQVAERHGLSESVVGGFVVEFWEELTGPPPFSVIHVWVGAVADGRDGLWELTGDIDEDDAPLVRAFGTIDLDLWFAEAFSEPLPIADLLREGVFNTTDAEEAALAVALARGITSGTAILTYGDPDFAGADFGPLVYLGAFPDRA